MRWLKVQDAATEWAGGISSKTIYAAIRSGQLRAARIGAGRNVLLCEDYVEAWLRATAAPKQPAAVPIVLHSRRA